MAQSISFTHDGVAAPRDFNYEPIKYKGLKITPALSLKTTYNDNIFSREADEEADYILSVQPALNIEKEFGTSNLSLNMLGNFDRYKQFNNEDRNDYLLTLGYKNQPNHKWEYAFNAGYQKQSRSRSDPTGLGASSEPLYYEVSTGAGSITRNLNRLSITLLGQYDRIDNEDGVSANNANLPIVYSVNDRNQYTGEVKFLYDLSPSGDMGSLPEKAIYLRTGYAVHDYDEKANTTLSRDRSRVSALAGFISNFAGLSLSTDIGVGYLGQTFKDDAIDSTHDLDLYARIQYLPSKKHILNFRLDRDVTQNNVFIEGITETYLSLESVYEIKHNLLLNSGLGYGIYDFDSKRKDVDISGSIGLKYLMTPRLNAGVSLGYLTRESNNPTQEFDRSVVMLTLNSKL